jgi:hypothetical protein
VFGNFLAISAMPFNLHFDMKKRGRKKGTQSKGYFFRTGRGWFITGGGPLKDDNGQPIRDRGAPHATLRLAYARHLTDQVDPVPDDPTLIVVCQTYLDYCETHDSPRTFYSRAGTLFDFCFGLPASLRNKQNTKQEREAVRIHRGFGGLRASQLKRLHVDKWIAAHPGWKGSRRTKIQALKRALNYCTEAGLIAANPIKGYKVAKQRQRRTYLTPDQEAACYKHASPALATAIKVCIRTGARYGCEFARLTARHVTLTDRGMEWRFSEEESKTGKLRTIRIPKTDPAAREVIRIVKEQTEKFPTGPIFRNDRGQPWKQTYLGQSFNRLRAKLKAHDIELDDDSCMYGARHTYAKRTLSGYWSGKPCTIERLAELMGNTREVCWEHYATWCEAYTDPLWESA